ncbi:MAG: lysozyme inhibitor LprI family protein [Candidatus Acidiferrum sp.]
MAFTRTLAILLCLTCMPYARAQRSKPIEKQEVADWYNKKYDCPAEPPMYFYSFDHFDFTADGTPQAIVVAMSCEGGTGGPDIHSVVSRDSDGELEELKIPDADPNIYDNLFGNRNYTLSVEKGLLVATFSDDPDRDNTPLTIKYKWNGQEFAIVSIERTGIYATSYDCTKKLTEIENVICHVDSLASLDVQLNTLYKSLLARPAGSERESLRAEQRQWLAAREKSCAIYKGWLGCLTDYYQKRIDALKKRATTLASQSPVAANSRKLHVKLAQDTALRAAPIQKEIASQPPRDRV